MNSHRAISTHNNSRPATSSVYYCGLFTAAVIILGLYTHYFNQSRDDGITSFSSFFNRSPSSGASCGPDAATKIVIDEESFPEAKCIDGSRPVYYLRRGSGDGVNKWFVHFEGGGWCYDLAQCVHRTGTPVGSSSGYPNCIDASNMKFYLSGVQARNPMMYNWNTVHVRYCDGGSYAGDAVVEHEGVSADGRLLVGDDGQSARFSAA
jgi:Pectinacetylesterase